MAMNSSPTVELTTPSDLEVVGTRVFDAPRELVFRAYTDPDLVPRWWGPRRMTTVVERMEVRAGGPWRYLQTDPEGNEFAFSGEYREVTPPERIVWTFKFEPLGPGHEVLETVTFAELDGGRTRMTATMVFASRADRDGMLESGMESGYAESLQRLDEILAELKEA